VEVNPEHSERDQFEQVAESFLDRVRAGEHPAICDYVARFPDLRQEIHELFPLLVEMEEHRPGQSRPASARVVGAMPRQLGDYLIVREIGHGGMGVVYEAEQISLGRRVALKLLPPQMLDHALNRQRFEREARAAARLHHTNIVPVFAVGEHEGRPYYAMQFIQGHGLDEVIAELCKLQAREPFTADSQPPASCDMSAETVARSLLTGSLLSGRLEETQDGPPEPTVDATPRDPVAMPVPNVVTPSNTRLSAIFSQSDAEGSRTATPSSHTRRSTYWHCVARIGMQVAEALDYAHKQGILHRDIKPSNLLLDTQETVWVTDFGLAKLEDHRQLTHTGDLLGTLRYMPAEAFEGKSDKRSDVYGLGLTLYEMLAMRPAYAERDRHRLIKQIATVEPARLDRINPSMPRDLVTIVHKAIEREPGHRYATAGELAADLRRFLDDAPIHARHASSVERLYRWCRRNPSLATLSVSVALLITLLAIVSTTGALWLGKALSDSKRANADAKAQLWDSLVSEARASRMTRRPGQRFNALVAIHKALKLPLPPGRSLDELRTEAIAALLLPDVEVGKELSDAYPTGSFALAMDPSFERFARSDKDGNVDVCRIEDGSVLFTLPGLGPVDSYGGLEFSPDGRFLYHRCDVGGKHQRFVGCLWKLDAPQPVRVKLPDADHAFCAFEPGGRRCALGYPDGTIRLLDLVTLKYTGHVLRHQVASARRLAWNPLLPVLAVGGGMAEVCQFLDLDTGKVCGEMRVAGGHWWLAWHPDGEVLAVDTPDYKIHLRDFRSGREVLPALEGHNFGGPTYRFTRSGDWLTSNDWSALLRIWDIRSGQQILVFGGATDTPPLDHASGQLGPLHLGTKIQLLRWLPSTTLRSLKSVASAGFVGWRMQSCVDASARWLAIAAVDGTSMVDLARCREVAFLPLPDNPPSHFDPKDGSLWTYGRAGLLRWPMRPDRANVEGLCLGPPEQLGSGTSWGTRWGFSPDGETVAMPQLDKGAVLWHRGTNRTQWLRPQDDVRCCDISPDGRWVATGSHGLTQGYGAKIWDSHSGQNVTDIPVGGFCNVGFSPKGTWLVTTGGGCRLWAVGNWQEGARLNNPADNATFVFSADEQFLALGDQLGQVRLVRPQTGAELARITISEATRLRPVCFTPDGGRLVVQATESQMLYFFDLTQLRQELSALGLDWAAAPLPPRVEAPSEPIPIRVDLGKLRSTAAAQLVARADRLSLQKKPAEALAALRQAIEADPADARAHNNLAWLLVTGPKELRDAEAALPSARRAVELEPQNGLYANTLGVTLYRSGHYAEAISMLEKSLAAGKGNSDAFDLFFLALSHHGLGEPAKAKDCYDRALKWLDAKASTLPPVWLAELNEIQAEADTVFAKTTAR
jgi:serine/threonine protein kinase/WD40 repeat protein/Tfp pilus assembly protein PilF